MDPKTSELLSTIVGGLTFSGKVKEVWLGGSHARGTADPVSDVDLWVVAADWDPSEIGSILLAGRILPMGSGQMFHGIAHNGTILDVMVGPKPFDDYMALEAGTPKDLSGPSPRADTVADFWINSYKHRKPLYRGLDAMVCFGLHHDRMYLLRMWATWDRGEDPGDSIFTISGLTPFIRDCLTPHRRRLLGLPCRTKEEIICAIDAYREEALTLFPESSRLTDTVVNDPIYRNLQM